MGKVRPCGGSPPQDLEIQFQLGLHSSGSKSRVRRFPAWKPPGNWLPRRAEAEVEMGECWQLIKQYGKALDCYQHHAEHAAHEHVEVRERGLYGGADPGHCSEQPGHGGKLLQRVAADRARHTKMPPPVSTQCGKFDIKVKRRNPAGLCRYCTEAFSTCYEPVCCYAKHQEHRKQLKQNEDRRLRNRGAKSAIKTQLAKIHEAVETGNLEKAEQEFRVAAGKFGPGWTKERDPPEQSQPHQIPPAEDDQIGQTGQTLCLVATSSFRWLVRRRSIALGEASAASR